MLSHPLPIGTLVKLTSHSSYEYYRVLDVKSHRKERKWQGDWYYSLCAAEWWHSRGIEVVGGVELFHGAAQTERKIIITAEAIYDSLRLEEVPRLDRLET